MSKGLSGAAKRNHIANYMASLPEEFEVVEDNLIDSEPVIILQTKSRVITLYCDEKGEVVEQFEMREGAGSKEDFLVKQEAYNALRAYYNDYYTGAKIKKSSFEEGILKIEIADRSVTLTYDAVNKIVEEKDRVKKKPKETVVKEAPVKEQTSGQMSLFDFASKPEPAAAVEAVAPKSDKGSYKKLPEGTIVTNACNNKQYKVKKDEGNIIEVFDKEHGYLIMARADLKVESV
jgi:hypothetical protein